MIEGLRAAAAKTTVCPRQTTSHKRHPNATQRTDQKHHTQPVTTPTAKNRQFVKPSFDQFVAPSRRHADLVVPWHRGEANSVAIDLIAEHIRLKLRRHDLLRIYPNLGVRRLRVFVCVCGGGGR